MKQSNIKIIGLTGGIATGKSTVSDMLRQEGQLVIDADRIAKEEARIGSASYDDIIEYFGEDILLESKEIDRKKLGKIVFNNEDELIKLNNITHPRIFKEIKHQIDKADQQNEKYIFIDIPLLFEELDELSIYGIVFNEIWLVYVDRKIQIERLKKRDNLTEEDALKRINAQLDINLKLEKSDVVLTNDRQINDLKNQVLNEILKLKA